MKLKRSYGFFDCFRATSVQEQVQKDKNIIILGLYYYFLMGQL